VRKLAANDDFVKLERMKASWINLSTCCKVPIIPSQMTIVSSMKSGRELASKNAVEIFHAGGYLMHSGFSDVRMQREACAGTFPISNYK